MVEFAAKLTGRPSASNFHPPLPLVTYFPVWLQRQRNFGDSHVSLRLISSNDDRVLSIRDHLLLLVRQDGELEVQRGLVRMVTWEQAPWVIHHWTPFNELHAGEASSPGYRHAVERQHAMPDLPYGLEACTA
jgi:hypothetical protein